MARTAVRIVAGQLRGRKLFCDVHPGMRPTPQMVREAFFSILGNAIPGRPFADVFAGTGVVGLEAISRGASRTLFVERDPRLAGSIEDFMRRFGVKHMGQVVRSDAYRWAERWVLPPGEPANVFLSPPFPDLRERPEDFSALVGNLCRRLPAGSVLVVQSEQPYTEEFLPDPPAWERRKYGRNLLLIWEAGVDHDGEAAEPEGGED